VEQELLTLLEHWSSSPVFVQFRVVQFLVFFAIFYLFVFSFMPLSFFSSE
jgi:hypothetical protein